MNYFYHISLITILLSNTVICLNSDNKIILIIGETQTGKSSLVKRTYEIFNLKPPSELQIGDGNKPSTKEVTVYPFESVATYTPVYLSSENNNEEIDPRNINYYATQNSCKISVGDATSYGSDIFKFTLIDVPGIGESEQADDIALIKILKTLIDLKGLASIIFVTNSTAPFSDSFKRNVNSYKKLFPFMYTTLNVVHTRFSYKMPNSEQSIKERINSFINEIGFPEAKHYFIDSVILDGPFDNPRLNSLLRGATSRELLDLYNDIVLKTNNTPLNRLYFCKSSSPRITNAERELASHLNGQDKGVYKGMRVIAEEKEVTAAQNIATLYANVFNLKAYINSQTTLLNNLTTGELVKIFGNSDGGNVFHLDNVEESNEHLMNNNQNNRHSIRLNNSIITKTNYEQATKAYQDLINNLIQQIKDDKIALQSAEETFEQYRKEFPFNLNLNLLFKLVEEIESITNYLDKRHEYLPIDVAGFMQNYESYLNDRGIIPEVRDRMIEYVKNQK